MEKTREFLRSIGLPGGDAYDLPTSDKRFPDGAQYRFEVPGIQGPKVMAALLAEMDRYGINLHRVTQTKGIMMLTDNEIIEMVRLAGEAQTDLILAIGPRATTDTSASVHTEEGVRMGYRLRGQEQIVRAIEDVKRATAFGCHSFLVYDEGCLWVLNEMKKAGDSFQGISPRRTRQPVLGQAAGAHRSQFDQSSKGHPVADAGRHASGRQHPHRHSYREPQVHRRLHPPLRSA